MYCYRVNETCADIHTPVHLTAVSTQYLTSYTVGKRHCEFCLAAGGRSKYGYQVKILHRQGEGKKKSPHFCEDFFIK